MADDDNNNAPSETSTRRSKRARVPSARLAGKAAAAAAESGEKHSGPSGDSPAEQVGREESFDDYEESPPRPKRGRTAASEGTSAAAAPSMRLIEVVKGNGKLITDVAKFWVEKYEKDPKFATVELLMMLYEACGAVYHIDTEVLDKKSVDDVVFALVNLAQEGNLEDYQNSKKKEFQNFKDNLVKFWDSLVSECSNGPLFDGLLFDKITDYVVALSCTPPRVYRQVASLVGLSLVTAFVSVANVLGAQRETTQRQLNTEMKKRAEGPRVDSLNNRLSSIQPKINTLEEMMRKIFQGLFVHRYRDIDPNIRVICIQSLGQWNLSYPSLFLQDRYLKYLGWTLNDKNAGVRKASVLALQNLYKVDDNVPSLSLFTERFSNRMIELADDIDMSVAVSSIGLINQLLSHQLLSSDDLGPIYDLLVDYSPEIRRAIGELVYDHLIAQRTNSSQTDEVNDGPEVHLGRMLQILREFSTEPILSTYVVDDIWEYMEAMKDWKCIVSMLLDENPSLELTDEDATNLIRLLCASAKKAIGERIVPATDNRKQHYTKAQRETFESNRKNITIVIMKIYPKLLRKYMSDKAKISSLAELILIMNLELYSLKRQEQTFKNVLQLIKEAFFKHGEKDALRSCVKAINFCTTDSKGELQDFATIISKELEDELITKLKYSIKDVVDGDDEYSLLVNMKRLYELHLSRPVPFDGLHEDIFTSLENLKKAGDGVVSFLLLNMYLHVAWSLHSIVNSKTVSEASISSLLSCRGTLLEQLEYYLGPSSEMEEHTIGNELASRVCVILAEVWCLFRKSNFTATKLETLSYVPDRSIIQKFWKLSEQQLSISDEDVEDDASKREAENKEYIEETNRDAFMIAAAKLVASDVVFKDYLGPEIISHFVMHGPSVAEIVKHLIAVLKKRDDNIPSMFLEALKRAHHRHLVHLLESSDKELVNKSFKDFHDLSVKLSGVFAGTARSKHRLDILKIVRDSIDYAFVDAPKHLSFLEGAVLHFISKLPSHDIAEILRDAQKRTENINTDEDPSGWRPYFTFADTVREKHLKNEGLQDDKDKGASRRRVPPRKRHNIQGKKLFDEQSSGEDDDSISGSDHDDQDDEEKQDDDDDAPLIHSIRASGKLRSLKIPRKDTPASSAVPGSSKS